jgi:hypothetical protein
VARRYVYKLDLTELPGSVRAFVEAVTGMGSIESVDAQAFTFSVDDEDDFGAAERVREMQANLQGEFPCWHFPMRPSKVLTGREVTEADRRRQPPRWVEWSDTDLAVLGDLWRRPDVTVPAIAERLGRSRKSVEAQARRVDLGPKARFNR